MKERFDYASIDPDSLTAMMALENYVRKSGLEYSLYELVKTRASQINKCG